MNNLSAINELLSLPRDYPMLMAMKNNDIVDNGALDFNGKRFFEFLYNTEQGIEDRIRIAKYGIDGPATVSIVEHKNGIIVYTVDDTRYEYTDKIDIIKGRHITMHFRKYENDYILIFRLISFDKTEHELFKYLIKRLFARLSSVIIL